MNLLGLLRTDSIRMRRINAIAPGLDVLNDGCATKRLKTQARCQAGPVCRFQLAGAAH